MRTAISLFTGCGGSDTGLIRAGFDVVMANDILPYAAEVYHANLPDTDYRVAPVEELKSFPKADLLAGCYPCQGFSQGGARQADRTINRLYLQFARVLNAVKPRAFVVENVSGMKRADFKHLLDHQVEVFTEAGYEVSWDLLNAVNFGVPQERKRIFIVGIRNDINAEYRFPEPTHGPEKGQRYMSIRDAIDGMPEWPVGEFLDDPFHWYYLSRNRWRSWEEPSKTVVSHPRHMPLHPMSPPLRRVHTDCWEWKHDGPKRRFSYHEAARLQGFPKGFAFPDTAGLRTKYKVVGNAVPPPLFEAVARALPDIW
ncbi:MAG: DNA cytosine methyltransferase [Ectothiorhodospiraceae bacterium]|nr:DNA cytosine methyltransferase [Ectothiorhodospiraceae bacterium]